MDDNILSLIYLSPFYTCLPLALIFNYAKEPLVQLLVIITLISYTFLWFYFIGFHQEGGGA